MVCDQFIQQLVEHINSLSRCYFYKHITRIDKFSLQYYLTKQYLLAIRNTLQGFDCHLIHLKLKYVYVNNDCT